MTTLTKRCTKTYKLTPIQKNRLSTYQFPDEFKIGDAKSKIKKYKTLIKEYENRPFKLFSKGRNCYDYMDITDSKKINKYSSQRSHCETIKSNLVNESKAVMNSLSKTLLSKIKDKVNSKDFSKDNLESLSCNISMLSEVANNCSGSRISIETIRSDFINKISNKSTNSDTNKLIQALASKYINTILYNKENPKDEINNINKIMKNIKQSNTLFYDTLKTLIDNYKVCS